MATQTRYEVIETMAYEVWASDEDEAVALIRDDPDRDARGPACLDRYAVVQTLDNGEPQTRETER